MEGDGSAVLAAGFRRLADSHVTRMERSAIRGRSPGAAPSRIALALHPGCGTAPVSLRCQSAAAKIFHFTEIRKRRMCRSSRLILEGRSRCRLDCEPGLRWTRQRRHERCGRVVPVSPWPRADERRCEVRLVGISIATCTRRSNPAAKWRMRVRQNRVVLAVVATVKFSRRCVRAQPGRQHHPIREAREARRNSAPGRARHKPSNHRAGKAE
jgi:hypothetical protein